MCVGLHCPATGTPVAEAREQALLTPLPETLPEPFDLARGCPVADDCLVSFKDRQYGVPFRSIRQVVEVRWLASHEQCLKGREEVPRHPRGTEARLLLDDAQLRGREHGAGCRASGPHGAAPM